MIWWIVAVAALLSCSSSPAPSRAPVPHAVTVLPDVPFADLDPRQREQLMTEHVLPEIGPLLARHDPQKFADVTCKTCHAETTWTMPNPELARLDLADLSAFDARDVELMKSTVVPAMRRLLRDPELRCERCHPTW